LLCFFKPRYSYGEFFVFYSIACVDAGTGILLSYVQTIAEKLKKAQLKGYLRSTYQHVVDENGKDVGKCA
jgi:hypothetical protein